MELGEETAGSDVLPPVSAGAVIGGNTFIGNMTGLPAMTLGWGFAAGPPKLPITIQFYGRPFDESSLFRAGHAYQMTTDWHTQFPALATA